MLRSAPQYAVERSERGIERDASEQGHAFGPDRSRLRDGREDLDPLAAVRALEAAHVLHGAEHRHIRVSKKGEELPRIEVGDVLRTDNHNGTVERHDTDELLLEICRARRKVEQQNVELSPLDLVNELPQRRGQERRSQRQCLPLSQEKSDRHDPDPMRLDRFVAHVAADARSPTERASSCRVRLSMRGMSGP